MIILILLALLLSAIILILPLDLLEFLSINVVGEPPINGRTWLEGVEELGGELSMRIIAILGLVIIVLVLPYILKMEKKEVKAREISRSEIFAFFISTIVFFIVNILIGYSWWDPEGFLGMGPLFLPSIASLIALGLLPEIFRKVFQFKREDFFDSTENLKQISVAMIVIALGYGAISCIWHCCSFFDPSIYFFYFGIKAIQLWGMCAFFFKWGFPMLLNESKEWVAYLVVSLLFGFCYPWHTFAYALVFSFFGFVICFLTRKTDSYLPGFILFYFAYIFHAGLPWNGPLITFTIIYPILLVVIGVQLLINRSIIGRKN